MFTGLIADVGMIEAVDVSDEGARLRVRSRLAEKLAGGDSIAVNGVCLTVAGHADGAFEADVMNRTLETTSLAGLGPESPVNLEPALRAADRLGGHIVQGHVDGTAEVAAVSDDGFARRVEVTLPGSLAGYVVARGSIALDGVSLTVAQLRDEGVEVSLAPETLERTTLAELEVGRTVNVEVDLLARYVERLLQGFPGKET
jgi:riboflavin synthase